jgi:hypothetical protein
MRQKRYDSDLTDSQWKQISRYFSTGRKRSYSLRYHVLDAILYIVKTGSQWRMLPGEFAPVADRLLLFSTVAGGGSNPMHFEHYLSGSSAPSRSARRTKCADYVR